MYTYSARQVHRIEMPLSEDPKALDALSAAVNHARQIAVNLDLNLDDVDSARFFVEDIDYQTHLVIELMIVVESR